MHRRPTALLAPLLLASVLVASSAMAQPPVCPVPKCGPGKFAVRSKDYSCPKVLMVNSPIEAELDCVSTGSHSIMCNAYPVEVPGACGTSGTNLIYGWAVTVGGVNYPYPPSYNGSISISCVPPETVYTTVSVWNGTFSDSAGVGMRCGDDPN